MRQPRAKRKASIADVAKAVGVSKTTISRYLHGEYDYMSAQTRERIRKVIEELDYRPNRVAQILKATRSNIIGVVIADISNPFSSQLLKGIQTECRKHDIQLLISDADNNAKVERAAMESLLDSQVDGLIVNTAGDNDDFLTAFATTPGNPPMATLDRTLLPLVCDGVATDNAGGVNLMMDHLVSQGFEYVTFVVRPPSGITSRLHRINAMEDYLATHAIDGEVLIYDPAKDDLPDLLSRLSHDHVDDRICLFANNEETLQDILRACDREECRLLERAGLCTFGSENTRFTRSGITCLDQNPVLIGRTCAARLIDRIQSKSDKPFELIKLPTELHVYPSTEIR
ncbi:LacI family DNA-binding transcriptional regulator [Bifidobacterium simiarum]|uniref:LacI family DNA-binding transcriptional regulator n=1 Tax=Bifidobacterium simiarum TaxID=2045441 RepID=UPI001BDCF738|nr:LacI family DNA-binding transcriptional regulator [Bifidobacterium simiarum]MBT1166053.1 LacI family DNA-binding transcriptional regulator [Bifidobacterium simiarum]